MEACGAGSIRPSVLAQEQMVVSRLDGRQLDWLVGPHVTQQEQLLVCSVPSEISCALRDLHREHDAGENKSTDDAQNDDKRDQVR